MILRLAHVEVAVDDLDAAHAFYVELLGFVEHARDGDRLLLRGSEELDCWSLSLVDRGGPGLTHSAYRVSAPSDLDDLEALHRRLGLATERLAAGSEPGHGPLLRVATPDGHRSEFVHEIDEIDPYVDGRLALPMRRPAEHPGGIPPTRIDHVSLRVNAVSDSLAYWCDELGFSASELWLREDETPHIAWIRRQTRSHDVALGVAPAPAFHHFAYAVADAAALVRAADLLGDARQQQRIEWGPGRHGATNALAMYVRDPAGNRLELYAGDYARDLDRPPLRWRVPDYKLQGHSWWGFPAPDSFGETAPLLEPDSPAEAPS